MLDRRRRPGGSASRAGCGCFAGQRWDRGGAVSLQRADKSGAVRPSWRGCLALLTTVALLTSLGACSSQPALPWCGPDQRATAPPGGYELGPGDRLRVTVFRHEPLSGEFTLGSAGTVALPLVGAVAADGLTARELESAVEDELREKRYLVDPDVSIEVLTHRPFYILGEVAAPGEYEYVSGMTLANAVALAGGYTYRADRASVTISRGHCVRPATAAARLRPGAIVRVPPRFF